MKRKLRLAAILQVAVLMLGAQISRAGKSTVPAASNTLQFTSGGHVLSFAADGVYVASGSHMLHVEFVNARVTNPVLTLGAPHRGQLP